MSVVPFPARGVVVAVRTLEEANPPMSKVNDACDVLLRALRSGEPTPSWSVRLLISWVVVRSTSLEFRSRIASQLAQLGSDEVIRAGRALAESELAPRWIGRILIGQPPVIPHPDELAEQGDEP